MKKFLLILLCLMLCVTLIAACGNKDESSSLPGTPVGAGAAGVPPGSDQADISTPSIGQDTPATGAGDSDLSVQTHTVTGTITDAAMGQLYVQLDDTGVTLGFSYEGADISGLKDTRPGNRVTITYTGEINGTDTGNITVLSITQAD